MESRKAEHNVELGRFKEELESLKSEHQKMEALQPHAYCMPTPPAGVGR